MQGQLQEKPDGNYKNQMLQISLILIFRKAKNFEKFLLKKSQITSKKVLQLQTSISTTLHKMENIYFDIDFIFLQLQKSISTTMHKMENSYFDIDLITSSMQSKKV